MLRSVFEEGCRTRFACMFLGMIAIWAQVIATL